MAFRRKTKEDKGGGRGGCPDYMVTYGDMMSLLLCFFVIIVSLSQFKEEQRFHAVMDSIKKAFGYSVSRSPMLPLGLFRFGCTEAVPDAADRVDQRDVEVLVDLAS